MSIGKYTGTLVEFVAILVANYFLTIVPSVSNYFWQLHLWFAKKSLDMNSCISNRINPRCKALVQHHLCSKHKQLVPCSTRLLSSLSLFWLSHTASKLEPTPQRHIHLSLGKSVPRLGVQLSHPR